MDLDTSYIEPLVNDWTELLQDVIKNQENLVKKENDFYMPFVALPTPIINAIFNLSEYFEFGPSPRYITLHLFDKFMSNYFWKLYKENEDDENENSWSQVCETVANQSKLFLMSCLQLASKLDSYSNGLGISQVQNILKEVDTESEYTRGKIFASEFTVFKTLEYKMPFCIPLDCIEILLAATDLRKIPDIYDVTTNLLDIAYLQHEKLYSHLRCLMQGTMSSTDHEKRNLMALKSNISFLSASIILCGTTLLLGLDDEQTKIIALKLEELVDVKDVDISKMANLLLIIAIQE